jgi:amylosucrase
VDYQPAAHRRFLVQYFTGEFEGSLARGLRFGSNAKTGDARISGSLASLVGLEAALEFGDEKLVQSCVDVILLLHSMIMSFGGIPLIYYGDEIGTLNNASFLEDAHKARDNRWIHRPRIDWEKAERRKLHGSVEQRIFEGLQRMIAVRKSTPAFADYNNRELLRTSNPHLFAFLRSEAMQGAGQVLVVGNFHASPQSLDLSELRNRGFFAHGQLQDLYSGKSPNQFKQHLVVPPYRFYWLSNRAY